MLHGLKRAAPWYKLREYSLYFSAQTQKTIETDGAKS
jgi:hypothetical protein